MIQRPKTAVPTSQLLRTTAKGHSGSENRKSIIARPRSFLSPYRVVMRSARVQSTVCYQTRRNRRFCMTEKAISRTHSRALPFRPVCEMFDMYAKDCCPGLFVFDAHAEDCHRLCI